MSIKNTVSAVTGMACPEYEKTPNLDALSANRAAVQAALDSGDKRAISEALDAVREDAAELKQLAELPAPAAVPVFFSEMPLTAQLEYASSHKPQPLPDALGKVAPWSYDLLPNIFTDLVRDTAERTQCPPDFVAVSLVCAAGAVIGRSRSIHPKQKDDWTVTPNLWGALVGKPSAMKSPAIGSGLSPINRLEAQARERYKEATLEHEITAELNEMALKDTRKRAEAMLKKGDKVGAKMLMMEAAGGASKPIQARYTINDSSVEKLGELLNENPNGLLLVRDELSGWLSKIQSEDGAVERAFYLESFDGTGTFVYDRISRGTIFIESCCLSLIGGIQPARIAPLIRGSVSGASDDGMVQRLQLAVWPEDQHDWQLVDRWPNKAVREAVSATFHKLDRLRDTERSTLRFTAEAQALFYDWYVEHMRESRSDDLHTALQSHYLKMPKTIAGLALIFELIENDSAEQVSATSTVRALDWADYLKSHALRLYGASIHAPLIAARLILQRRDKLPEPFTPRELCLKKWAGLGTMEEVNDALTILADHDYLVGYIAETGGRPSMRYVWKPE